MAQDLSKLHVVFMGTPPFAAHILTKLIASDFCTVTAAYCQPDRPAGRGKKLMPPAVKVVAQEHNLPVYQPLNFKNQEDIDILTALKPDVLVVAAYGLLLPQAVLDIPRIAPINIHGSLLPLYRGAAPIQRAIMNGDIETGVAIMQMEAGLDSGPVYCTQSVPVAEHTSDSMHELLSDVGADTLLQVLYQMAQGEDVSAIVQDHSAFTHAPKLRKEEGIIDWSKPAAQVHAQIRSVTSWPAAQASILRHEKENCDVKISPGRIGADLTDSGLILGDEQKKPQIGEVWRLSDGSLAVATYDKWYLLDKVRPQGKGEMDALAFANGYLAKGFGALAQMQLTSVE